uniref:C3H1-type domain-containing protein n=1 Tax=Ascaris lumbricoides TaxID=6252 RepID=A0A0M3HVA2_ASCLU
MPTEAPSNRRIYLTPQTTSQFCFIAYRMLNARSIVCFLCDSYDGNCQGSTCVGNACIKRHAFMESGIFLRQLLLTLMTEASSEL